MVYWERWQNIANLKHTNPMPHPAFIVLTVVVSFLTFRIFLERWLRRGAELLHPRGGVRVRGGRRVPEDEREGARHQHERRKVILWRCATGDALAEWHRHKETERRKWWDANFRKSAAEYLLLGKLFRVIQLFIALKCVLKTLNTYHKLLQFLLYIMIKGCAA